MLLLVTSFSIIVFENYKYNSGIEGLLVVMYLVV